MGYTAGCLLTEMTQTSQESSKCLLVCRQQVELGLMFKNKHDLGISSRNTVFNVQISSVNTLSLFKDVWRLNYKFNLSLCYFS